MAPVQTLLQKLAENDRRLEQKYLKWYIGGGLASLILGSILGGMLIAHCVPMSVCSFTLLGPCAAAVSLSWLPSVFIGASVCLMLVGDPLLLRAF